MQNGLNFLHTVHARHVANYDFPLAKSKFLLIKR